MANKSFERKFIMALERKDVPENRKWRLCDIFKTKEDWEKTYKEVDAKIDFQKYEGKLANRDMFKKCFEDMNSVLLKLGFLDVYAMMNHDQDTRSSEANALVSRIETLGIKFSEATAFVTPELTALPEETLKAYMADKELSEFDYTLRQIINQKPHVLSREIEELLSRGGKVFGGYQNVFSMIDNADFCPPEITVDGEKYTLTHGGYGLCLQSKNRNVRRAAFEEYYKVFMRQINTITATYSGNVEKDVFIAKTRKYGSAIEMALDNEDVSREVYENLLACVHNGQKLLHRYVKDRKEILGYDELHMYDIYTPLVENAEISVDYEDAFKIVKEGLKPLGEDYGKLLQRAHDEGWIDVEETAGKRSGAYSVSVYGLLHPYVLLNYQKTTNNVFTIAHELGHAMHSYFSERNQPQTKADYRIFVAEVASTVNEVLLLKYLIKTSTDKKLKKYLLSYYMDMLKGTMFRQTQFAEFEYIAHEMAQNGEPLTKESLCAAYLKLNRDYYGDSVISDDEISYEWARIPHFYRSFYVYKYATGIISAVSIAERIYNEGDKAVADYFKFLSSGGSDSPTELLKLAGVDLKKKDAFESAMKSFEDALCEFETL